MKMNKLLLFIAVSMFFSSFAFAGKMFYYKDANGGKYKICKDKDGYVVYKPSGKKVAHGVEQSWKEVKKQYRLSKAYRESSKKYKDCP